MNRPPIFYPAEARQKRVEGSVVVELTFNARGEIVDSRVPIPGVTVAATNIDTGGATIAVSNETGKYRFQILPLDFLSGGRSADTR